MKKFSFVFASFWLLAGIPSQACGPRFYETILDMSFAILRPPESSFDFELSQMKPDLGPLPGGLKLSPTIQPQANFYHRVSDIEIEVLEAKPEWILKDENGFRRRMEASDSDFARDVAEASSYLTNPDHLKRYLELRAMMLLDEKEIGELITVQAKAAANDAVARRKWPAFLPAEIRLYLDGAADYSEKKFDDAIAHFKELLALPLEERRHRSTWAAYMAGRSELAKGDDDLKRSMNSFRQVSTAREAGCHDALELGWDVLGIEADFLELSGSHVDARKALRYRFALAWEGEGKLISTMRDFRYRVRKLAESGQAEILARDDPFLRQIFTAAVLNSFYEIEYWNDEEPRDAPADAWLEFLDTVKLTSAEAPSAANLAYKRGDLKRAGKFLASASKSDPTAIWLQSKLKAKNKQFRTASRTLAKADEKFARPFEQDIPRFNEEWRYGAPLEEITDHRTSQFWGNRGILHLASNEMVPAMEAFLRSGHWRDAAYVAEQLISREQLLTFVRSKWPTEESTNGQHIPQQIRYLTARRLARDRYFKDARPLFPAAFTEIFDVYVENYRTFRNTSVPDGERAKAGWNAAQIHRRLGIELFGTEVGPDYACFGGNYGGRWWNNDASRLGTTINARLAKTVKHFRNPKIGSVSFSERHLESIEKQKERGFFPPATAGEKWSYQRYGKLPNVYRWHYRHVAADLAWEAAALLPDNQEEKAQMMNIAGKWLATNHPQNADFFYKSLVRKNRNTPTGHLADMRRWFVDNHWRDEYDPWIEHGVEKPKDTRYWSEW